MYPHVPLTIEGNYIDHLATSECSTGKPLVLSFIFYVKDCFRQSKALRWQDNPPCHTIKTSEEQCDMRSDKELKTLTRPQSCPGPSSIRHARASPHPATQMSEKIHHQHLGARHHKACCLRLNRQDPSLIQTPLKQVLIWGIWRPGQHFQLFTTFLRQFLSSFYEVAGHIVLLTHVTRVCLSHRGCASSASMFVWMVCVKLHPGSRFPQQNMINVIHFNCH